VKIMIVWKIIPGRYKATLETFLRTGGMLPAGAKSIGRWHVPGSALGWHVVEGELAAVAEHVGEWSDLLQCEVYPVMEDAEVADIAKTVLEKS
jgi:hypothetical protein